MNSETIQVGGTTINVLLDYCENDAWHAVSLEGGAGCYRAESDRVTVNLELSPETHGYSYELRVRTSFDTRVRLRLRLPGARDVFHLIPCNIYGDNNLALTGPGEYPHLTDQFPDDLFCAPLWEFRADRAALPVSLLCHAGGVVGISIAPYSEQEPDRVTLNDRGFIRNGVFAQLPDAFGVSLGYGNDPGSFLEKKWLGAPTRHVFRQASARGRILAFPGDRRAAHRIMRELYGQSRELPLYRKTDREAVVGLMDAWLNVSWGPVSSLGGREYYRNGGFSFDARGLTDGRPLCEIGWTGGGPMLYPFALAESILGLTRADFGPRKNAADLIEMIVGAYNPASGFFNDLTIDWRLPKPFWDRVPLDPASRNNGWWAGYIVGNQHTAYNNGSACYYILKTIDFWRRQNGVEKPEWVAVVLKVLDTVIALQREDGNYGYAYSEKEPKVELWEGFAGCWFAAACAFAAKLTGRKRYADSARRAVEFYHRFVKGLNCYGTPMDTLMAVDEEGVLAFIRACRVLHEVTGDDALLAMMNDGAEYEYLWRYGFRARPEYAPLKDSGWNSCGGSVTSVSNPHIHPMGVFIADDLRYLADRTGDDYHRRRAEDSLAWAMQCLEIYPDAAQCGIYGVMTERFCPSDGLIVEKNRDGTPFYDGCQVGRLQSRLFFYLLLKVLLVLPSKPLHPDLGIEHGREVCINHHIHPRVASANHFSLLGAKVLLQVFQVVRSFVTQGSCLGPPSIRVRSNRCTTCSIRFSAHDDQIKRESNLRSRAFSAQGRPRFPYNLKSFQNPSLYLSYATFNKAPSGISPNSTYFHSATNNFLATATIPTRRFRGLSGP